MGTNFDVGRPRASRREQLTAQREAILAGDAKSTQRQRARNKLTPRERIDLLLDEDSFVELDIFRRRGTRDGAPADEPYTAGVVSGSGTINGRTVYVYAQDFRINGGALDRVQAAKIHKVQDLALQTGSPIIALNDGGGARIQDGVAALAGYGGVFRRNVAASGVIPQISVILGPCAGGAAYSPALTDFVFVVSGVSYMFLTGPDVVRQVTAAEVTMEELGGAQMHASTAGTATFLADDEPTCLEEVRYLVGLLPSNWLESAPSYEVTDPTGRPCEKLLEIVPTDPSIPYDMREVIEELVDDGEYMELHAHWAQNVVCALARIGGRSVGIVGNQPIVSAGVLDIDASDKAARFVRTCDSFGLPIVSLVDVPGFLPGLDQEHAGIIRHGAKLLFAYCEATVPRVQIILRKAYGGAYIVMDSRSIGSDISYAWPTNEVAVMGAAGAVSIIHGREIAASDDPEGLRESLIKAYEAEMLNPLLAAEQGFVDDVIDPATTRMAIARALETLSNKRPSIVERRHGNPPV